MTFILNETSITRSHLILLSFRYRRAFIEAAQEYLKDIANQDDILMNVLDYFTEKWNEKRSGGTKGQMKLFKFTIDRPEKMEKMKILFKFSKVNNEVIFQSYRTTAPQSLKEVFEGKAIYNKRKLNEFIHLVSKISNPKKRFDILKEFVYNDGMYSSDSFFRLQGECLHNESSLNSFLKGSDFFPILPASFYGHKEILEWIFENKEVDVNEKNSLKSSSLHFGMWKEYI